MMSSPRNKTSPSNLLPNTDFSSIEGKIVEQVLKRLFQGESATHVVSSKPGPLSKKLLRKPIVKPPPPYHPEISPKKEEDSKSTSFKIPTQIGEMFKSSTILSSPSNALNIGFHSSSEFWDNNPMDPKILSLFTGHRVPMKFHPKYRHFQTLINGDLKPTLPKDVMSPNFVLPSVPRELHLKFSYSRIQLQNAIIMFSTISETINNGLDDTNNHSAITSKELYDHAKASMINEANNFGLIIQEIRRTLLHNAYCKDPNAIRNFINAPLHVSQFFGQYVITLQKKIQENGSSFCIQAKSTLKLQLPQVPHPLEEAENPRQFIIKLNSFINKTKITELDKTILLRSLLPETLRTNMDNHCGQAADYKYLLSWIIRYSKENRNFIKHREAFILRSQKKHETVGQFGETLVAMKDRCQYGELGMELLRDQFIFGLSDETIQSYLFRKPFWSFQQCFEYATGEVRRSESPDEDDFHEVVETETHKKRRISESPMKSKPNKRFKSSNQGDMSPAPTPGEKPSIYSDMMHDPRKWLETFDLDVPYSFGIYCPWTGVSLR